MNVNSIKKFKINLTDYNYRRDIEVLSLLSSLSEYEISLLQEVLNNSLKFDLSDLVEALESSKEDVLNGLERLSKSGLLKLEASTVNVDKELRKQYEFHIERMDETFKPNIEFIQALLSRVSVHILPTWYNLPRSSDHIFLAIVEKHLLTPKIYERYLQELALEDKILEEIKAAFIAAQGKSLIVSEIQKQHQISKAQLIEYLLLLEFNFIAYFHYKFEDGKWQEVLSPFQEWQDFQRFCQQTKPEGIKKIAEIKSKECKPFFFVDEMTLLLENSVSKPIDFSKLTGYKSKAAAKLQQLGLGIIKDKMLSPTDEGKYWLSHSLQGRALELFRDPTNRLTEITDIQLYNERNTREVEKSLRRVMVSGWIYFEDFIKGLTLTVGTSEAVNLKQKGKQWRYVVPNYTAAEQVFIERVIFERLFELGLVDIGVHDGKKCFCVTPFARLAIGEQ